MESATQAETAEPTKGAANRFAMVVKLHRHADDFCTAADSQGSRNRAVDAAGHGDDDARLGGRAPQIKFHRHRRDFPAALYPNFTPHR